MFTRAHHWFPSWIRRIQFTPSHPVSLRSFVILTSHLCLDLSSGLFPTGFPTKIYLVKCTCYEAPHYVIFSSLLPLSSLLDLYVLLSTLFSNTFNLCSSLSVRDQVSHPYTITSNIIFKFSERRGELNDSKKTPI